MSADNYYIIRIHPLGGFAAVMGFASDTDEFDQLIPPLASPTDPQFPTVSKALDWAISQYSEYGADVHMECEEAFLKQKSLSYKIRNLFNF